MDTVTLLYILAVVAIVLMAAIAIMCIEHGEEFNTREFTLGCLVTSVLWCIGWATYITFIQDAAAA